MRAVLTCIIAPLCGGIGGFTHKPNPEKSIFGVTTPIKTVRTVLDSAGARLLSDMLSVTAH